MNEGWVDGPEDPQRDRGLSAAKDSIEMNEGWVDGSEGPQQDRGLSAAKDSIEKNEDAAEFAKNSSRRPTRSPAAT